MTEKVKVAVLISTLAGGGAERFSTNLINMLEKKDKYDIFLLSGSSTENEYDISPQVKRIEIIKPFQLISDAMKLRRFLAKNNIHILVAINIYENFCATLANVLLKTKVIICERSAPKQIQLSWYTKILRKLLYWRSDYFVFQTEGAQSCYAKNIRKRSIVIPNPVKENLPFRENTKKEIVALGRLYPVKRYDLLIKAFYEVCIHNTEYILRILGDGTEKERLYNLVKELRIQDRVYFEGFKSEPHIKITGADIYVLCSDYEGMPNSLMEAMAMGFPVIATDCPSGGTSFLIQNEVNGLLIPVNDASALAHAILKLIGNADFKERLADKAAEIRNKYSGQKVSDNWIEFLEDIL